MYSVSEMIWLPLLILLFLLLLWLRYTWMHVFLNQKLPGPNPHILFGNVEFRKGILECMKQCREKYGRTFSICFGAQPALVTSDTNLIQEVLVKNFDSFRNRNFAQVVRGIRRYTLLSLKDENWRRVRGVLSPTFSTAKLKQMSQMMIKRCDQLMKAIEQEADDQGVLDFYGLFQRLTLDIILECAFAMEVNSITNYEEAKPMLKSLRQLFRGSNLNSIALLFPLLGQLIPSNFLSRNTKEAKKILDYCREVIKTRKNTGFRKVDTLQFMIDSMDQQTNKHLSEDEVLANTFVFLLAGYETTSTALSFTAYLLALHPEIQERLYKQVCNNVDDMDEMGFDAVKKLSYLDQVWNEALRLYPPAAGFFGRQASDEVEVRGIKFPVGSWVMVSPLLVHNDPDYWPDPLKFLPERWAPEKKDLIKPNTFLPFGEGPRNCIGKRFAEIEAKLALVKLVKTYRLEACDKTEEHPMNVKQSGPIMHPTNEVIYLRIIKR